MLKGKQLERFIEIDRRQPSERDIESLKAAVEVYQKHPVKE
jgi:hypothetical protein